MRKLYVTKAGYWYVVLTIALGVVALVTANNVLYLMECLLLGGMILSGVISERAISSLDVQWVRKQATAGQLARDVLLVANPTRFSFFCLEFGEWSGGRFDSIAFVTKIGARSQLMVPAPRKFEERGQHSWEGVGVATSAPFGFARKILVTWDKGSRIIWPEKAKVRGQELRDARLIGGGVADAEVRPYFPDDDIRGIIWKLSAKGVDPVARKSHVESPQVRLTLNLKQSSAAAFENEVRAVASSIYGSDASHGADIRLRILGVSARKTLLGRIKALNYLATAAPEGKS